MRPLRLRAPRALAPLLASLALLASPLAAAPSTNDLFSRTVSNGWGSTPQGQAYTAGGGTASDFSVNGSRGEIKLSTVNNRLVRLGLGFANVEGTVRVALDTAPSANHAYAGPALRIQSSGNDYYFVRLRHNAGGGVMLTLQKIISGSQTSLTPDLAVGSGYTPGSYWHVRYAVAGTGPTLFRAKAWPDGTAEPALWQLEITDSTSNLQASGGVGLRAGAHSAFAPLGGAYRFDDFQIHHVAYVANLKTAMQAAVAGDILYFTGVHTGNMKTFAHGTAAAPILVRGVNATIQTASQTTGYGVEVLHDHWRFDDFTINHAKKGFYAFNADHGVLTRVDVTNVGQEGFKFRRHSNHWQVVQCSVDGAGQDGNDYGEGFYVGDAQANWASSTTPDTSGHIVFRDCHVRNVSNDAYDVKEGARYVKFINCVADFSTGNQPVGGAPRGDSGFYLRGDDIQLIGCSVVGLANGGAAYNVANLQANGTDHGNRIDFKAVSATDITQNGAMFRIQSTRSDHVKIFTDWSATNVANFKVGSGTHTSPSPGAFVELVW
jgi:hypothetical protein